MKVTSLYSPTARVKTRSKKKHPLTNVPFFFFPQKAQGEGQTDKAHMGDLTEVESHTKRSFLFIDPWAGNREKRKSWGEKKMLSQRTRLSVKVPEKESPALNGGVWLRKADITECECGQPGWGGRGHDFLQKTTIYWCQEGNSTPTPPLCLWLGLKDLTKDVGLEWTAHLEERCLYTINAGGFHQGGS